MSDQLSAERERALLGRVSHDPEAFRELYAHYFPKVFAYVAYRVRRRQDTEDLVSEIFLCVVEQLDRFEYRGENTFAAWIFRIAYNIVSHFRRRQNTHWQMVPLDDVPDISSNGFRPDQIVAQQEVFLHLSQLIEKLPARRQEVVTLRYLGGLRNQEIAKILDLDERTVASHLSRGLKQLQDLMESERENA